MTSGPRAYLHYVSSGRRVERPLEGDRLRLGRSPELEIVFPESESGVSRHHATFVREGDGWAIEDAGSRNGTFVNGKRVDRITLKPEDRIDLGPLLIVFHVPPEVKGIERETVPGSVFIKSIGAVPDVQFSEGSTPTTEGDDSTKINLRDVEQSIGIGSDPAVLDLSGSGSGSGSGMHPDRAWAITLFKEVGRALTVATNLDEMLETVMLLAFTHVPAERGVICLIDEERELDVRVVRTDSPAALGAINFSRTIVREAIDNETALLVRDVGGDERFSGVHSIAVRELRSAICVPLYHEGRTAGVVYVDTANRRDSFTQQHLDLLVGLGTFAAIAITQFELRERAVAERIKREKLCRYHAPAVVDRILHDVAGDAGMLASKEDVTVLFADIRGFTAMSETMSPTEVVELLNTVFGRLVKSVFRHRGTLDKFMGDGMLAYFGAPLALENHALAAIRAAREMQETIAEINADGSVPREIGLRIGLNSGPAVVGDVGSTEQSNHTVIGDTVNVASRLEANVAQPGEIVVGPTTHALVRDHLAEERLLAEELEPVTLKGKRDPLRPFRVTSVPPTEG